MLHLPRQRALSRAQRVVLTVATVWLVGVSGSAHAQFLEGDLNGDGSVDSSDEALLVGLYGASSEDPGFEPAADWNGDGRIDHLDLAELAAAFGSDGGSIDVTPPGLLVSLNDIPDDMNDLLVVPPDNFVITLQLDSLGESALDTTSLSVTSSQDIGPYAAGSELASLFTVTPTRAAWQVPAGSGLALTSHYLGVSVKDAAGNEVTSNYGFAVRNFAFGAPLENLQTIFLDFDQDRSLGPEIDFIEDLRSFGLSSSAAPSIETQMRDWIVQEILERARPFFGLAADGSPGVDSANLSLVSTVPAVTHARLCVGGESSLGSSFLGATLLDVNNLSESEDNCGATTLFGIFPQAIDNIWGSSGEYHASFDAISPSNGGVPVGEHSLDATVLDPLFDPASASGPELARKQQIDNAVDAFSQLLAAICAHEVAHGLGLVAHGPAPAGLWGGSVGAAMDHNVDVAGSTPGQNFLMNAGNSFSFEAITGRAGQSSPVFRPLNWAYLRDRVALNSAVTELLPPPQLDSVSPNPASYPQGASSLVTFLGSDFKATPTVLLQQPGDPTPDVVLTPSFVDSGTVTGVINKFIHPPGLYDVTLINPDGQRVMLSQGLLIQ